MPNLTPQLIFTLALQWAGSQQEINQYERDQAKLIVYEPTGDGYYFIYGHSPAKWYYKSDPTADHFCNTDLDSVRAAIDSGARVQLVGARGKSFGLWRTWEDFNREVLA